MGGASREQEYRTKALTSNCFDISYGKLKGRMIIDIIDRVQIFTRE